MINRRDFTIGIGLTSLAGTQTGEFSDTFEGVLFVELPQLSENERKWGERAVERLLKKYPGTKIAEHRLKYIGRDHPRWPDGIPGQFKYAALRTVKLDRVVEVIA